MSGDKVNGGRGDNLRSLPTCQGKKSDGSACERLVSPKATFCYSHDPAHAAQRRATASKAGSWTKGVPELASLKRDLRKLAEDVLEGKISTGKGSVVNQVLGTFLKVIEQERRQREQEQLAVELAELKEIVERNQDGGSYTGSGTWG
jgi:hypothetical protein